MKKEQKMSDDFGRMLKRLRVERGLSLADLSNLSSVSISYINRLEKSKRKAPSFPKMVALAEALNVDPWVLAGSSLNANKGGAIGIKELLFSQQVEYDGMLLTSEEKDILLEIIESILTAEWTKESMLLEHHEIGELISELKEH